MSSPEQRRYSDNGQPQRNRRESGNIEVNAWANYDQTAKQARHLASRQHSSLRRRAGRPVSDERRFSPEHRDPSRRSSLERRDSGVARHSAVGFKDIEANRPELQRLAASEYGTAGNSWSCYFQKLRLHSAESTHVVELKKKDLSPEMQEAVHDVFAVYFEGGYRSTKESNDDNVAVAFWRSIRGTMPWLQTWIEDNSPFPKVFLFLELCLRGIGQVFFQNNPISGLLILIGLFVQSTRVAIHGIIAVMSGNLLAFVLHFDKGLIRSGLFGYNSVLVGLALATFDNAEKHRGWYAPIPIASILFGSFSSILFVFMGKILVPYKSPPLTLPFNVATLIFLAGTAQMARVQTGPVVEPSLPDYSSGNVDMTITVREFFAGVVRGVGQVYLANEISSGLLIWTGIAVCSRISAVAAIVGSALGAALALATGAESSAIEQGLYGFNASLTVTAMFMFYTPSCGAGILAALAGIVTVAGQQALATFLSPFGLPFMTLPFCVASLPFIILQGTTTLVIPVPLATLTIPEDHYKRVFVLQEGFGFLMEAMASSHKISNRSSTRISRKSSRFISEISLALNDSDSSKKSVPREGLFARCQWRKESWVDSVAPKLFDVIDDCSTGQIKLSDIIASLTSVGLVDKEGLNFVTLVFMQLDFDENGTLERNEFLAFCAVSVALQAIRHHIARFFDFVDMDENGFIDFEEIDAALEYLGEKCLSPEDREAIVRLTGINEDEEIDAVELTNLVTVAKVKVLAEAYHDLK